MDQTETKYAIALSLLKGIGSVNAKKLLAYCGSFEAVFKANKSQLEKIPGIGTVLVNKIFSQFLDKKIVARAEEEIEFIEKNEILTFLFTDKNYPINLKQCEDAPIILFGKGNINFNNPKVVSIVGTRKVTDHGKTNCKNIIEDIKGLNPLIISGLAYGVDICAHKICVENNLQTIGVLAHGLDRIYPAIHANTAKKMLENGGLLTEFISGTNPDRENFPKRNRIIAGIADTTLVIESARRGGSLITAEIANSYSRDVFAVPGRITDTYSEGCNFLIKTNKAHLINSGKDIIYLMNWEENSKQKKSTETSRQKQLFLELNEKEQIIYDSLKETENLTMDKMSEVTGMKTSELSLFLLTMELNGIIKSKPGSIYKLN